MDSDERLTELKKAYADIILNTAKEAAARIMVSERKAQRFEHDLKVAKEEALRMLLRLKQMMDVKISEAEVTALNQQKKIEELEAQLHEAEDIVKDLREELREAQAELGRVRNHKTQHLNNCDVTTQGQIKDMNRVYNFQSIEFQSPESQDEPIFAHSVKPTSYNFTDTARNYYNTSTYVTSPHNGNHDLPSIILRSKAPESYRNGCTQRIRACERNLLDRELSFSRPVNSLKDEKGLGDEGGKLVSKPQIHDIGNGRSLEKQVVQADRRFPNWSSIPKRKRVTRYRNKITDHTPDISCLRTQRTPARDDAYSESPVTPNLVPNEGKPEMQSTCPGATDNEAKLIQSCTGLTMENTDEKLITNTAPKIEGCSESSNITVSVNIEKYSPSLQKLECKASETSNCPPNQAVSDRMFKYTFQRKRRRDSLIRPDENVSLQNNVSKENGSVENNGSDSNFSLEKNTSQENPLVGKSTPDENTSQENNTLTRKLLEEQNASIGLSKSFFVTEPFRDSKRLVQVAHQLLSLSEKKW